MYEHHETSYNELNMKDIYIYIYIFIHIYTYVRAFDA